MLKLVDFSYQTSVVSESAFHEHLKLYNGYVNKVNDICHGLENADKSKACHNYSQYRGLKKELSFCLNGVMFHEMYFRNMGDGSNKPGEHFLRAVGDFDKWKEDFIATAKSARGWALCCFEQRTCKVVNVLQDSYSDDLVVSAYPLLLIDMYEHSYFTDYKSDREAYIECFMDAVNWQCVEERAKSLEV